MKTITTEDVADHLRAAYSWVVLAVEVSVAEALAEEVLEEAVSVAEVQEVNSDTNTT